MPSGGSDLDRAREGDDADWESLVRKCARSAARRHRVADWAEDLAQEVHLVISKARDVRERVTLPWIRRTAHSLARKEFRCRRKAAQAQRWMAEEGGEARDIADDRAAVNASIGIPDLCQGLARLVEPGAEGRVLERLILACALAVIDDILGTRRGSGRRAMIFRMAYAKRRPIGVLAAKFEKPRKAVTEQLRRMSKAVEWFLLAHLDLPPHIAAGIATKTANPRTVQEPVRRALEAFLRETRDADRGGRT